MDLTEKPFDLSTFSQNRARLLEQEVARSFFVQVVEHVRSKCLLSDEHSTVYGMLIEAWASLKSLRPKDEKPEDRPPSGDKGNPTVDFRGEKRCNDTHVSTTDAEANLARKGHGKEARLSYGASWQDVEQKIERHTKAP
jgi:hypothetical protein